jgi:hypothetical protein
MNPLTLTALIGATLIIVRGTIFTGLRKFWPPLLECSQCTGMWVGFAAGASSLVPLGRGLFLDGFVLGCAVSVLAMLTDAVLLKLLGDPAE